MDGAQKVAVRTNGCQKFDICHTAFVHLNLQTDYGLRILMLLAAGNRQMSVDEIARSYGISRNHLAKVAQRLQSLGHIKAARGRGGGLKLAVPAAQINVGAVVRQLESLDCFVECMNADRNACPAIGVCGLQGALALALSDFLRRLDSFSVADLLPRNDVFLARMDTAPAPEISVPAGLRVEQSS